MMRSLLYVPGRPLQADLSLDELAAALKRKDGLLWVDFVDEPNETCEPILRDLFGFHPVTHPHPDCRPSGEETRGYGLEERLSSASCRVG